MTPMVKLLAATVAWCTVLLLGVLPAAAATDVTTRAACERLVVHKSSSLASEGIQHDRGAGSWSPTQTLVN